MLNISQLDQQAFELSSKFKSAIKEGRKELKLSPGVYHLRGNLLEDRYCFVSNGCYHKAEFLGDGNFKIEANFSQLPTSNTPIVFMHGNRVAPGIFIDTSKDVEIENTTVHHAPGMALIAQVSENNYFHVDGAAIEIQSDSQYWWESGPVEDVEVRNNHFDDCGFGINGKALFHIGPDLPDEHIQTETLFSPINSISSKSIISNGKNKPSYVHKNVWIHDNRITRHNTSVLIANHVDGLVMKDNEFEWSQNYPRQVTGEAVKLGDAVINFEVQEVE